MEARIIAVADTVEAICAHRPYRPAKTLDDAIEVIMEGRGKTYDTDVVDACLEVIKEAKFDWVKSV